MDTTKEIKDAINHVEKMLKIQPNSVPLKSILVMLKDYAKFNVVSTDKKGMVKVTIETTEENYKRYHKALLADEEKETKN